MTKTALISGQMAALAFAAGGLMPGVESDVKKRYETRPGEFDEGVPDRISVERGSPYFTSCGAYLKVLFDGICEITERSRYTSTLRTMSSIRTPPPIPSTYTADCSTVLRV